ncbi:MAG: aspartate 1-decarboxylase [Candidatus Dadabacteria bacterium]|nr:aspartate 1-decarboxylase [Candidatus Dadabacteria bacterium]NIS10136.1 aspartate 1-decarboxylase [Candidatus Dadabacteria bacterium]NIY23058.1 aspartate 1-decarboxylase [Candidatus Dadabacteria bacterium]
MHRTLLKSKIHRATVTDANVDYEGSVTIDRDLMSLADLQEYEQVQIYNITNGNRLTTYVIEGEKGSGDICINGAAAHLAKTGDLVIIANFASYSENEARLHKPKLVYVNEDNSVKNISDHIAKLKVAASE